MIVKSILVEMKERSILEYPDSLIDATMAIVQNPELLTVLMTIIFQKTNAYDSNALCQTMTIIQMWLNHVEKQGKGFPSNFDLNFFFKGLNIALDMDHSVSTPRTLYMLFKTLHFFPIDQRNSIIQKLLKNYFYQFFFSWSYNIRDVYIALLLYQLEYGFVQRLQQFFSAKKSKLSPSALEKQLAGSEGTREQLKLQRQISMQTIDTQLQQYEALIQQNPNEAEEYFDLSFSVKSMSLRKLKTIQRDNMPSLSQLRRGQD